MDILLDKYSNYATTVSSIGLTAPQENRLLCANNVVLIAARNVGLERVIALGFDWQNLNIADHVVYESTRNTIWEMIFTLVRKFPKSSISREMVTPKEALAKFLVWYVLGFLVVYVIVLSLLNWLVLRKVRRFEYGIFTLPSCAFIFTLAAFGVGMALRSKQTIVYEAQGLYSRHSAHAVINRTNGWQQKYANLCIWQKKRIVRCK